MAAPEKAPKPGTGEEDAEKIPYPKAIPFIIVNEFCERFSYYGMRTILSLYLRNNLKFTERTSKMIYHTFVMLCYFFPLLGAIISDNWLGKFKTIFYLSIVYACGNILLAISSTTPLKLPRAEICMLSLFLISLGTGGIKPCVSSFGGDQFVLPQQEKHLTSFFFVFYFAINCGSLLSTVLTPILRKNVKCFDDDTCYPLAFGVPGVLMIVALAIFLIGRPFYTISKPERNISLLWMKCVSLGLFRKCNCKRKEPVEHWLDRTEDKFEKSFIEDVKTSLAVLLVFTPVPMFWGLFEQQGSGWTFQATRMDGSLGSITILPDQFQLLNPLLVLLFIPMFNYVLYPLLAKCRWLRLRTPLQKMAWGGLIAAAAFALSVGVSLALEADFPSPPGKASSHLRFFNAENCTASITAGSYVDPVTIDHLGYQRVDVSVKASEVDYTIKECENVVSQSNGSNFRVKGGKDMLYFVAHDGLKVIEDDVEKDGDGLPKIRTLVSSRAEGVTKIKYTCDGTNFEASSDETKFKTTDPGKCKLKDFNNKEFIFRQGGVYVVLIAIDDMKQITAAKMHTVVDENSIHMFWLIPQYFVITMAEIMVSITGLEFSYQQAPVKMKSVMTSFWLLTNAFGQLVILIVEASIQFQKTSVNFMVYTALMVLVMLLFIWVAIRYKYRETEKQGRD